MTVATRPSVVAGEDGVARCPWAGSDPDYQHYHDSEWGKPLHGDQALFEKISLEGFQAGLSWITILRRREAFRRAFHGFDIAAVAAMGEPDVARLLNDESIIRHRGKIEATLSNARITHALVSGHPGALDELVWSFAPRAPLPRPRDLNDYVATTPESIALSKQLRSLGFRFVGPTTMYALMQSAGLVDDHVAGCYLAAIAEGKVEPRRSPREFEG